MIFSLSYVPVLFVAPCNVFPTVLPHWTKPRQVFLQWHSFFCDAVEVLNIRTPEIILKFEEWFYHTAKHAKDADKMNRDMTKQTKWVCPAKTQISLGIRPVWSESSLSAWRKLGSLATHWAHSEDWSDWVDAQADLSLRWAHIHFVGFVMSWLKWQTVFDPALGIHFLPRPVCPKT